MTHLNQLLEEIKKREWLLNKYSKEYAQFKEDSSSRSIDCMEALLNGGMTEHDFISHVISIEAAKEFKP